MKNVFKIPRDFSGEDRFLGFFDKVSFIGLVVAGVIFFLGIKLSGLTGAIIGGLIGVAIVATCMIKIPKDLYLKGAGQRIFSLIYYRIIFRKMNKVIYAKCTPKKGEIK